MSPKTHHEPSSSTHGDEPSRDGKQTAAAFLAAAMRPLLDTVRDTTARVIASDAANREAEDAPPEPSQETAADAASDGHATHDAEEAHAAKDHTAKDHTAKDHAAKDHAAKDHAAEHDTWKSQTSGDHAAKDPPSSGHPASDESASTRAPSLDPEAVHDLRVALRKLRTLLRPARRVFGRKRLQPIEEALRRDARATSALRDEEALRETIDRLNLPRAARAQATLWIEHRAALERTQRAEVIRRLEGTTPHGDADASRKKNKKKKQKKAKHLPLEVHLHALTRRLDRPERKRLGARKLAQRAVEEALDKVQALSGAYTADAIAMHELRIRFKRLRYTADAFAPVLGPAAKQVASSAAKLQKRLGHLHDVDEALDRVWNARDLDPGARAALHEALTAERAHLAEKVALDLDKELPTIVAAITPPTNDEAPSDAT
ncbi:CHAD domain-containing protein [Chondromyces crocatus]|uniref:CHAD domain-containing protein n=1 Tax=Chondromyces crocatus TaxID=52 RepID=A0A0K1E9K0_CHOCO|nr:CHAD domain-containing protein [Chondromyces crocatus]AKT37357.1 uncharacterized protein CMC5_014920 [Chondromyces crocatus]